MNPLFLLNDYIPGTCSTNVGAQYGIPLNGKHGLVFDGRRQQSGRAGLRWFERTGGRGRAVAFFCCTSESWRSAVEGKTHAHCDCKT